jgi:hypothetical protein
MANNIDKLLRTIEDASVKFNSKLPAIEKILLDEILLLIKDFSVKNGKIVSNMDNLKLLTKIKGKIARLVFSREYVKDVSDFVQAYSTVAALQNDYFKGQDKNFKAKAYYPALKQVAIDNTIEGLTESGVRANVLKPVTDILLTGITSGQSYAQMEETLRKTLTETPESAGALSRYAKTYTVDSINQFSREYMTAVSNDLGYEWYRYLGSNKATTREFCEHMTKKEYVHRSEFAEIVKGNIDGHQCRIYENTGLPYGMKEGTDADNFTANCGGWNCGHQLVPLREESVPEGVRDRIKVMTGLRKLSEIKRSNDVLYSDITGGIAAKLSKVIGGKLENREKARILNDIISLNGFETVNKSASGKLQAITKKFATIKNADPEYSDNMNAAKSLNNTGFDVYMIPKLSGAKSPDFILKKGNQVYLYELKTIYGKNSVENRLNSGAEQSDRIILNIVGNVTSRNAGDAIQKFYLKNPQIKEIKVLLGGKMIDIRYGQVREAKFIDSFMKRWAR